MNELKSDEVRQICELVLLEKKTIDSSNFNFLKGIFVPHVDTISKGNDVIKH